MKAAGHVAVGLALALGVDVAIQAAIGVSPFTGHEALCIGAIALGSLAPDVDSDNAAIRNEFGVGRRQGIEGTLVSGFLRAIGISHRGATHSLAALFAVTMFTLTVCYLFLPRALIALPLAVALGYGSHLVGDMLTPHGVPLMWPGERKYHLLPKPLRFRTGSVLEWGVTIVLGIGVVLLLPKSFVGQALDVEKVMESWLK